VNARPETVGAVMRAHVSPRFVSEERSCRRRESFGGRQEHRGEFRFATEGNAVNPRIGSGLQYGRRVEEEQPVEVVRNHEDGRRMGSGFPIPKGARGPVETPEPVETPKPDAPGSPTPRLERRRGDLWTTP